MRRCLELAKNGLGTTHPNPVVGCVIVYKDTIIGEGWHKKSGEAHAEVLAINSVKDASVLPQSTLYVSLEPCSHFGKTPPCANLVIAHNIPNVVIGTVDPNVKVSGNGIRKLQEAGIQVTAGVLEKECMELNRRFFTFHQKKRPYIILKWAATADGFIAPETKDARQPVWITNPYSRQLVHKWRGEEHAILVGTQTVVDDNPKLNVRDWAGNNPIRIVIDKSNRVSKESHIFDNQSKTIALSMEHFLTEQENLVCEAIDFNKNVPLQVMEVLYRHNIVSVIIEGGAKTLQGFIDAKLWDEARVFKSPAKFLTGTKAPLLVGDVVERLFLMNDELLIFRNHDQHSYF